MYCRIAVYSSASHKKYIIWYESVNDLFLEWVAVAILATWMATMIACVPSSFDEEYVLLAHVGPAIIEGGGSTRKTKQAIQFGTSITGLGDGLIIDEYSLL